MTGSRIVNVLAAIALLVPACSETKKPPPGQPCLMNTDCQNPLSCTFGKCHETCREARDCPAGQLCARATAGNVCVLPEEEKCGLNSQCPPGLFCGKDLKCRNQCETDRDCATSTQKCVASGPNKVCAEPPDIDTTGALKPAPGDAGTSPSGDAASSPSGDAAVADAPTDPAQPDVAPDVGAMALGSFQISNIPAAMLAAPPPGTATVDGASCTRATPSFNSNTGVFSGCTAALKPDMHYRFFKATQTDGSMVGVLYTSDFRVDPTMTLSVDGELPLAIVATGTIRVLGKLEVRGKGTNASAGGFAHTTGTGNGPGAGKGGATFGGGGGGGSYCGRGGKAAGEAGVPGPVYGTPENVPLLGGSSGGGYGGGGGGAIQLVAGTLIEVTGTGVINAGGGGAQAGTFGGGSGGAVLLEAPQIRIFGAVAANGGAGSAPSAFAAGPDATADDQPAAGVRQCAGKGGDGSAGMMVNGQDATPDAVDCSSGFGGGGGAGYLRFNSTSGMIVLGPTAKISPALGTTCATQGTLK